MNKLKFKIITPEREVNSLEIDQVSLMTTDGEITILPEHIPLVSILQAGELKYKKDGRDEVLAVSGGFVEVKNDGSVYILADTAEMAGEIDMTRAEEAIKRAEKSMEESRNEENIDFTALKADLQRAMNRMKIGKKYKKLPQANITK